MAWNQSTAPAKPTPKKSPSAFRGIFAGLVVVLLAVVVFFYMFFDKNAAPQTKPNMKCLTNRVAGRIACDQRSRDRKQVKSLVSSDGKLEFAETNDSQHVGVANQNTNRLHVTVFKKRTFDNATDQLIAMALSSDGSMPAPRPPLPVMSDVDFRKSLDTPIVVLETDSDHVRAVKEKVIAAREEIKARMDEGETFTGILSEFQGNEMENFKIRKDAMVELKGLVAAGDVEGAKKYVATMNLCFQQMGIQEIKMPSAGVQKKLRNNNNKEKGEPQR